MNGRRSREFRQWYADNRAVFGLFGISEKRAKRVFKKYRKDYPYQDFWQDWFRISYASKEDFVIDRVQR